MDTFDSGVAQDISAEVESENKQHSNYNHRIFPGH